MNLKTFALVFSILFACHYALASDEKQTNEPEKTFLYFAYGCNLLTTRIHKDNPSAKLVTIAKLKDHYLDFIGYVPRLHGADSSIVPSEGGEVWGVVWRLSESDIPHLDKQEMVHLGVYFAKNVTVQTVDGEDLLCRTYQQTVLPEVHVWPNELPPERQPSPDYMNTVISGAEEHNLPSHYVDFLRSFRDNGYRGETNGH